MFFKLIQHKDNWKRQCKEWMLISHNDDFKIMRKPNELFCELLHFVWSTSVIGPTWLTQRPHLLNGHPYTCTGSLTSHLGIIQPWPPTLPENITSGSKGPSSLTRKLLHQQNTLDRKIYKSLIAELNHGPFHYKWNALPLSQSSSTIKWMLIVLNVSC